MASFISTFSLFLLILVSGYFTLPLTNEQLQTSTMSSSNVHVTSERPSISRELLKNQGKNKVFGTTVQPSIDSFTASQMTTSAESLSESASQESHILKEVTTLSPLMLTTDESNANKRDLNDLLLTTVESSTEEDNDDDTTAEDDTTMTSQSEPKSDKREVSLELTTNTLPLTSTSSDVTSELNLLQSSTNSIDISELTTEESSSSKPSKKFTGLLKDKKDHEQDSEKEKDDEDKKPIKSDKTHNKVNEDDKVESDGEDKKPIKSNKTHNKVNEDDKVESDDEDKKPLKPTKTHKNEKEDDKVESDDEDKKPVKSNKTYNKVNEDDKVRSDDEDKKPMKSNKKDKEDDKVQSDEDSKNSAAPTAQLDSDGMKNVSNYPKEYMDLDENNTFSVTQIGSTGPTTTFKYKKGKKPLNEGEESSTIKEEESNN